MDGIALAVSGVPVAMFREHALDRLVHDRGGEREIRFLRSGRRPILPVMHNGRLRIVPWGSRSGPLPRCGLTWLRTVEAGEWLPYGAESIVIPASLGLHGGVWYRIHQGIRGVLVESGRVSAAYALIEPASHYYRVMTRGEAMPVLIGERI